MKYKGLLVPVDGPIHEVWYENYKDIQRLIDCDCFTVMPWLFDDSPACYVDDEGKLNGKRPNRAVYFEDELVDVVFGDMLFGGMDLTTGESRNIEGWEIDKVRARFSDGREGPGSGRRAYNRMMLSIATASMKKGLRQRGKI